MPVAAGQIDYLKLLWKIPALILIVLFFIFCNLLIRAGFCWDRYLRIRMIIGMNKLIGRIAFLLLQIEIDIQGHVPDDRRVFIVSNHLSYIDPLVLFNAFRAVFVTSVEVRENKLLGPLCVLGGCYFVERRNKFNIKTEIADVGAFLQSGFNVVLFPEGTSSDGESILRFKSSFFQVAVNTQVDVLPAVIRYTSINGEEITPHNRSSLYWYGNMDFFTHLFRLLSLRTIMVQVRILECVPIAAHTKTELATRARQMIADRYLGGGDG